MEYAPTMDLLEDEVDYNSEGPSPVREASVIDIYGLVQETVSGKITIDILVHKISDMLESATIRRDKLVDLLADTLVQCEIECSFANKDQKETLVNIIKSIVKAGLLPLSVALERFDIDSSAQLGIIPDKKQFMVSYNRLRTKLYFKQRKYNLLREESEGFARILTELARLTPNNPEEVLDTITEIIGKYRVDPNRVLDLILEVFEYHSRFDQELHVDFLDSFYKNPQKITQLIILKLGFYSRNKDDLAIVPQSFYRLLAILINKETVDIEEVYPYLMPKDIDVLEHHKKLVDEARSAAKKYAMAIVGDEKPVKSIVESLSDEQRHVLEQDNQKINLCAHLMDIGDWDQAVLLAKKLPEYYCLSHPRVARSACDLINYLIDPIYRECGLPKPLNARIRPISERGSGPAQIKSMTEVPSRLFPMLSALGPFLSADTLLLTKVIRLLRYLLLQKDGEQDLITSEKPPYGQILDVINDCILPAVSLSGSNCCLARELWTLIKNFKYHIRYKLYYNWRDEGSNPTMLRNRGQILLRAKHHMKRLSKETLRFTGRHIGKLCYSNPVITLSYILIQIQSYDNLIGLVVDALRFLPPIALDALIYCIIEALSDPNKNKKSHDGMAIAQWLTSLSTFSASIILRYKVDFTGFLEYIANQLKSGNSLDLILLTDLIQKMTGIETIQAITDERIEALMGGDILRTECAYFNQVKNTRKSSIRLKDALIESRLAMPLCISIAQLRDGLFFNRNDETHLKLIGKLYDQCQETLVQYGVFLAMNLSIDDYINFLPPLNSLMTEYKLDPDSAFFLARPMIFHKIKLKFADLKQEAAKETQEEEGESSEISFQTSRIKFVEAARSVIDPIAKEIQPSLIEKYGTSNLNSKLFVIFWTLSMSDIEVPVNCYEREIQRLKSSIESIPEDDPKRRKERDRTNILIQKLKHEEADQIEHTKLIRTYLDAEKNNLFCERFGYDCIYLESRQFVQHCPFARSILTAYDAIYSARFLMYLHELRVEDYPTIICLDRLLCDLTYMMGACTENEANHYGRFLCNILKTTALWHSDPAIYKENCQDFPGSIINIENSEHITYDNYRDICYKWHYRLTRAFTVALESNNYVQIRNALIVMISIIDYYPAIKHFGKGIGMKIDDVRSNEKDNRQDLYALATAYTGKLDEKKPHLIPESNFHTVDLRRKSDTSNSGSKNGSKNDSAHNNNLHKKEVSKESSKDSSEEPSREISKESCKEVPKEAQKENRDRDSVRSSSRSRPSSKTRPTSSPSPSRERHSSSSSRKRARHG